ncbi:AraC family transcriptional regulator [Burkholderia sp. WAC0059]|uniref:AraC family transcriptional regulator n=1 Tax=Burkholderia sp. WAC0059 TaxID=2066022 RepID=UPI001C63D93F|nr:AraC family transcriptional regulator [Burkholderia sp. WAC0059]
MPTAIGGLFLSRRTSPSPAVHLAQGPMFGMVVQGKKSMGLGSEVRHYGVGDYLLVSFDVPVTSRIVRATRETPQLGLGLEIFREDLHDVLDRLRRPSHPVAVPKHAGSIAVARASQDLLDATLRLLRLLDAPADIPVMAPLVRQEIIYRLLLGPHGSQLIQLANANSPGSRIAKAIDWLRQHYAAPLRMAELARHAGMSESSLYHHFKAITRLTPVQYQKRLRLHEARRLIQLEHSDIASAGYAVGYQSRSQFSREYRRLYGLPPALDMKVGI